MLYLVRGVLPVFIIGGVIAFALEPLLQRLEKSGRSRPRAVVFVFFIYILILLILFALLAAAVQQAQPLVQSGYLTNQFKQVTVLVQNTQTKIQSLPLPSGVQAGIKTAIDNSSTTISDRIPGFAQELGTKLVTGTGGFLVSVFLITLVSFGLMLEAQRIKGRMLMLVPPLYRRDVTDLSTSINELLGRYVRGQLIVCATFGALCTVAFEVLNHVYGMQYPLVLGAFAGFIYVLPYFGLAVTLVLSGLTAYLTAGGGNGLPCAVAAVGSCIAFNLLMDYGVSPRVLGRGVGLHPLMVIFALLCGFELGGPLGTLAAVPIFASLRVILIYLFPQLAAPLPDESPEKTSQDKPHSATTEMTNRVARAEQNSPNPPSWKFWQRKKH